jgi:hypothetical protein
VRAAAYRLDDHRVSGRRDAGDLELAVREGCGVQLGELARPGGAALDRPVEVDHLRIVGHQRLDASEVAVVPGLEVLPSDCLFTH